MLSHGIKFNQASFEYYLLQITPKVQLEHIEAKLKNFKKLEQKNNTIVLALAGKFEEDQLKIMVAGIREIANKLNILFHSILHNELLLINNIAGIPVISLPQHKKSNHIYNKSLVCDEPVRSGIKLENDGDIIINSFVSDNAEIIAANNIHVYGEARGKLIAGSYGDKTARIFAAKFNAELIAIGGIYKVFDNKLPDSIYRKPVMVSLDDKERLNIVPL